MEKPEFVLLAGPSGSGKTTFTQNFPDAIPSNIVTPDAFFDQFNHLSNREARVEAIALADKQREELIANKQSFTQETILTNENKLKLLQDMRDQGYSTRLVYMCLENPQDNEDRVRNRIEEGGNFVPADVVQNSYHLSLANLPKAMMLADKVDIYDNSKIGQSHTAVAHIEQNQVKSIAEQVPQWVEKTFPQGIQAYLDQTKQSEQEQTKERKRDLELSIG